MNDDQRLSDLSDDALLDALSDDENLISDDFFDSILDDKYSESPTLSNESMEYAEQANPAELTDPAEIVEPQDLSESNYLMEEESISETEAPVDSETIEPNNTQPISIETLPVLINFDVGSATMTLEQIQSLKEGYCFELPNSINDYVTLKVHNQTIAKGELVTIGDRLGVEITHTGSEKEE